LGLKETWKKMLVRDVIDKLKRFRSAHRLDGLSIRDMIEEGMC
jgi:hypothetical protein